MVRTFLTSASWIAIVFALALVATPNSCEAKQRYLILRTPAAPTKAQPTRQHYPGYKTVVSGDAYSYGYFGANPRRHSSRYTGYYNNYIQWANR